MFRIVSFPSTGSMKLYLTEIRSGLLMCVVCLVGVWQRNFEPVVCLYGRTVSELLDSTSQTVVSYRTHTPQVQNYAAKHQPKHTTNISETLRVISVTYSSIPSDDGSHTIRNMSE